MAEVLGAAGSVLRIINLCFKVTQHINEVTTKYKLANATLSAISSECLVISTAVERIQSMVAHQTTLVSSRLQPGESLTMAFDIAFHGCETTLSIIADDLEKIGAGSGKAGSSMLKTPKARLKFIWSEGGLKELLQQLRAQHSALNLLLGTFQM